MSSNSNYNIDGYGWFVDNEPTPPRAHPGKRKLDDVVVEENAKSLTTAERMDQLRVKRRAINISGRVLEEKKPEIIYNRLVEIQVGRSLQAFTIHKSLATKASKFFEAALNGAWMEGKTLKIEACSSKSTSKKVEMPEDDAGAFKMLADWLYRGGGQFLPKDQSDWFTPLGEAWLLGQKLQAPAVQNSVMDVLVANPHSCIPEHDTIASVYEKTMPGPPLPPIPRGSLRVEGAHGKLYQAKRPNTDGGFLE